MPNPVDLQKFKPARNIKKQDEKINIVFLGRLVERKGAMQLLKAVNVLPDEDKERIKVTICGKGPLEKSLKRFSGQNNLDRIVKFTGFVNEKDKPTHLNSADIAVFPSMGGESFGIVLIEAMASGAGVVIGGDNPGYRTVLGHKPELLFDPSNTDEFSKTLGKFIRDEKLRQKMGAWQSEHVKSFNITTIAPKIVSLYNEALRQRRGMR